MRVDNRPAPSTAAPQPQTWTTASGTTYTEPAAKAALARGHGGERVKALQQQLNAAGLKPPLDVDGLLGPKTEAALQKLTGSKVFDAKAQTALASLAAGKKDGFESTTPRPPTLPEAPTVQVPANGPPPSGSLAERTLQVANGELGTVDPRATGPDGKYQGWQHLQDIFAKTTGWRPSDKEIQASSQPQHKSWCGLFATHVLQEAGANVKWDLNKGQMVGDVAHVLQPSFRDYRTFKAERQTFENSIKPGDVITLNGKNNHHAIVTKVNGDGSVETIDGNKPHIGTGHQKLADVTSYYRPTASAAPAAQAPAQPQAAAAMRPMEAEGGGRVSLSSDVAARAEAAVAGNTARTTPVDFASLQDVNARRAFLQNVTQLDGVNGGNDTASCGPTALVSAMLMGNPKSVQVLSEKILNMNSADKRKLFGDDKLGEPRAAALRRLRDGQASPADVQVLSQVIGARVMNNGSTSEEMMRLVGGVRSLIGSDMPDFSLHLYSSASDSAAGLHWQGYANGVEIDPWPNERGQSTILDGKDGLGHGAGHYPNGTVHTKLIVQNHGKKLFVPRYVGMDANDRRTHNPNVNQPIADYVYESNWLDNGYTRKSGTEPAGSKYEPPASIKVD